MKVINQLLILLLIYYFPFFLYLYQFKTIILYYFIINIIFLNELDSYKQKKKVIIISMHI